MRRHEDADESAGGEGPPEGGGEVRPALTAQVQGALDAERGQVDVEDALKGGVGEVEEGHQDHQEDQGGGNLGGGGLLLLLFTGVDGLLPVFLVILLVAAVRLEVADSEVEESQRDEDGDAAKHREEYPDLERC